MHTPPRLYSLGHSNRSSAVLLRMLREAGIGCLVDVRSRPQSRRHPHFGRGPLQACLHEAGIGYRWEGAALGGLRPQSGDASCHTGLAEAGFRAFAAHMDSPEFRAALGRLLEVADATPTAFMCAEARPESCHRQFIADYLHCRGVEVIHLLGPGEARVHVPRPELRLRGDRLIYDARPDGQLGLEL